MSRLAHGQAKKYNNKKRVDYKQPSDLKKPWVDYEPCSAHGHAV